MPAGFEDLPFQHYSWKHRAISWVSRNVFDHLTYTVQHGHLKGLRRKGGLGWVPGWLTGEVPDKETRFLTSLDLGDKVVYDIGAFHGIWAMFFAQRARRVVCFEPNSRNRARLRDNLDLNNLRNVTIRDCGLGSEPATTSIVWNERTPGGASIEDTHMAASIQEGPGLHREQIRINTLDGEASEHQLPAPDFIKMDVEGYELKALLGARELLTKHRPEMFIEIHGDTMREKQQNARAVVSLLESYGYRGIRHVESETIVTTVNSEIAARGHLYCPRVPNL